MKKNEGTDDRILRVVLGVVLIGLGGVGFLSIFGVIALVTGLIGYCPLYNYMGKSTLSTES